MKKIIRYTLVFMVIAGILYYLWPEQNVVPFDGFRKEELPKKFIESSYFTDYNLENKFVIYVDFGKSRKKRRLWVVDQGTVIATSYTSHGKYSASYSNYLPPKSFSNKLGSNQSSLGIFRILFQQKMNPKKKHYCSCQTYVTDNKCSHYGLKFPLIGLESSNNNALERGVIIHTARYVSEQRCNGNSDGCFVVSPEIFELLQQKKLIGFKKCYLVALR